MTSGEFVEATGRLENYFAKEYTPEQSRIMYEELKEMSIQRYRQLVSALIRKSKFLPKIADFIETNKEEPYQKSEEVEKVYCSKCEGTGYLMYKKVIKNGTEEMKYTYACLCTCGNAKQYKGWEVQDKRYASDFYVPTAQELGF